MKKSAVGFADRDLSAGQNDPRKSGAHVTAEKVAAEFGIGQATVRRAAEFAIACA